jgi:hypothetical protein
MLPVIQKSRRKTKFLFKYSWLKERVIKEVTHNNEAMYFTCSLVSSIYERNCAGMRAKSTSL